MSMFKLISEKWDRRFDNKTTKHLSWDKESNTSQYLDAFTMEIFVYMEY